MTQPPSELSSFTEADLDRLIAAATPDRVEQIRAHADNVRPFLSPAAFAQRCTLTDPTPFQRPPHVELLNRKLVELVTGTLVHSETGLPCHRLMVTMPPQHGKSELCSKYFPAWVLARWPEWRVMLAAYEADFAATWGAAARDLIEENPWCGVQVRKDARAADQWLLQGHQGRMVTAGIGGPTTGKGGVGFIIDDPVKNADEANSPVFRERNWQWYLTTSRTRLRPPYPGSPIRPWQLVIQTRWHEDDLAGRILEREPGKWETINLPALAEEDDPLGRPVGAPLWSDMHPLDELEEARALDPYVFASLYQQHPSPKDGGSFAEENFRLWTYAPGGTAYILPGLPPVPVKECFRFQTSDWAVSKRTRADYTVISTWDVTRTEPANLVLVDRFRARIETDEHVPALEQALARWKPTYCGIEKATYGLALLQRCVRRGLPVRPLEADRDKVSRSALATDMVREHRVFFPRDVSWLNEWTHELLSFPNGTHDDQVDTLSYAAIEVSKRMFVRRQAKIDPGQTTEQKIWAQLKRDKKARLRHPVLGRW